MSAFGKLVTSCSEHCNYHTENTGFFSIFSKKDGGQQRSYPLRRLPELYSLIEDHSDVYLSQAEFFKPNRRLVNLARIGLCFIDLDYYRVRAWSDHSTDLVAGAVRIHCEDNGIPLPSAIIDSGQGLYLKWYLSSPIPVQALPRWNAVQTELVTNFAGFGSDARAKDASRVLRVVGTRNRKTGRSVDFLWQNPRDPKYEFEALCREVLPADRHRIRQKDSTPPKHAVCKTSCEADDRRGGLRPLSAHQLNWNRLADLRTLAALRGGVAVGQRDAFFFLATCFTAWNVDPTQLLDEVTELATEFAPGMHLNTCLGYASTAIRRAEAASRGELVEFQGHQIDPRYRFKNQTLIDWLGITPSEEVLLKTIISRDEKAQRHRQRNRKHSDRQTYLSEAAVTKATARKLSAEGMRPRAIAEAMRISIRSVYNYLKDGE